MEGVLAQVLSLCYTYVLTNYGGNTIEMFNTKLLTYDVTIKESTKEKIKHLDYKDKETLGVVVTNLLSGVRHHTPIVYSRRKGEKIVL